MTSSNTDINTPTASNPDDVDRSQDPRWTTHQFHVHLLTSLLPHLLRIQAERNIRIINLVSPAWSSALPSLKGVQPVRSALQDSGIRGLTTLLLMQHFQLILDTLAASTYLKATEVPDPNNPEEVLKKRDKSLKSNIMALSVVMPWARGDVIRGTMGADESWLRWLL